MRYKDVSDRYPRHTSVHKSTEWFLVRATFREIRRTGEVLNKAKDFRSTQQRYPEIKTIAAKLVEATAGITSDPQATKRLDNILIVDRVDLELLKFATKLTKGSLKLLPEGAVTPPAARWGDTEEPYRTIRPKDCYL